MFPEWRSGVNVSCKHWSELTAQQRRERLWEIQQFLADLDWCRALEKELETQFLGELDDIRAAAQRRHAHRADSALGQVGPRHDDRRRGQSLYRLPAMLECRAAATRNCLREPARQCECFGPRLPGDQPGSCSRAFAASPTRSDENQPRNEYCKKRE